MRFCHDGGTTGFEVTFGPASDSKINKTDFWIPELLPMVPSTSLVFALNKMIYASASKDIFSMAITLSDDGCNGVLPGFESCNHAKLSDSNHASYIGYWLRGSPSDPRPPLVIRLFVRWWSSSRSPALRVALLCGYLLRYSIPRAYWLIVTRLMRFYEQVNQVVSVLRGKLMP